MIPKTFEQSRAERKKAAERKAARAAKQKALWAGKPGFDKRGKPWTVGKIKKRIVRLLGLLDRKNKGPLCRYETDCPRWNAEGPHEGDTACHLVPRSEGLSALLDPLNVVWGCGSVNNAERRRREYFATEVHPRRFGAEFMAERRRIARTTTHEAKRSDLVEMLARLEAEVGA